MYCPNCGQQQVSEEMRFCSRCGLALTGLAEWLAGARLPLKSADQPQISAASPRRQSIRRAAKLMFFSGVLFPVFLVLSFATDEGVPLLVPLAVFFAALAWMVYALLFADKTPLVNTQGAQTSALGPISMRGSLRPANTSMTDVGRQKVRTNELAKPPSVTEHTTKLLDNE